MHRLVCMKWILYKLNSNTGTISLLYPAGKLPALRTALTFRPPRSDCIILKGYVGVGVLVCESVRF